MLIEMPTKPNWLPQRVMLAGILIDPISGKQVGQLLQEAVERKQKFNLAHINMHGIWAYFKSAKMRDLFSAPNSLIYIDGMPIVWLVNLGRAKLSRRDRITTVDFMHDIFQICISNRWKVVLIGSSSEGAVKNCAIFKMLFPSLELRCFDGYFDINDFGPDSWQTSLIKEVNEIAPALILVGMGMPRQEEWMSQNRSKLDAPIVWAVGGFSDYFTGVNKMPPRWLGRLGLEWAYRLATDPQRLAFRYLVEPFIVLFYLIRATLAGAKWGPIKLPLKFEEYNK